MTTNLTPCNHGNHQLELAHPLTDPDDHDLECARCGVRGSTLCHEAGQHQMGELEVDGVLVEECAVCGFQSEEDDEIDWQEVDYRNLLCQQQAASEAGAEARRDEETCRQAQADAVATWQAKDTYNQAAACWAAEGRR
jgi:transcription elongation factor Elf1